MKSILLRLVLASALALGSLTACKKPDAAAGSSEVGQEKLKKDGTKKKLKKDGTKKDKKKDKKPKDITDPVAPAPSAPPEP